MYNYKNNKSDLYTSAISISSAKIPIEPILCDSKKDCNSFNFQCSSKLQINPIEWRQPPLISSLWLSPSTSYFLIQKMLVFPGKLLERFSTTLILKAWYNSDVDMAEASYFFAFITNNMSFAMFFSDSFFHKHSLTG